MKGSGPNMDLCVTPYQWDPTSDVQYLNLFLSNCSVNHF